jgi:hypothetical protein
LDQANDSQAVPDPWRWWDVTDKHGVTRRYLGDDFDEFYRTSDERDVHRHLSIGWLLLEESVISGAGPGHWELQLRPVSAGGGGGQRLHEVPELVPDNLPRFLLGHLKQGVTGRPIKG